MTAALPDPPFAPTSADADNLDTLARAALARLTGSLSPAAMVLAAMDWTMHLAAAPGKRAELALLALRQWAWLAYGRADGPLEGPQRPLPDRRFADPSWQQWPYSMLYRSFLLGERWWQAATHGVAGVERHHEDLVAFAARQWLDMCSPGNLPWANPVVLRHTVAEGGTNLLRGVFNWLEDMRRLAGGEPAAGTDGFVIGRDLAATPGKVVLRNRLIELIQYAPAGERVFPEPVLLVPAWIMKYYILDLSAHDSLVKYLVEHGHTVFCISWKNPGLAERDLGMDDYLTLGVDAALAAIGSICPGRPVHAAGYCLGGTLLAIAAAAMGRDGVAALASTTYLAAQTDFTEPGELGLFIDESQLSLLEAQMWQTGYLRAGQMAGAFSMLRSYDLLWSRMVGEYLLGRRSAPSDLMAWNADATRMPGRMHSEYLRRLFLRDDFSEGRYPVGGRPVSMADLRLPTFVVGTETDHVAPWRSVYKLHLFSPAPITFVLTQGGHNAGIVNPPSPDSRRGYRMRARAAGGPYQAPDEWLAVAGGHDGSWWPAWQQWLAGHSQAPVIPPSSGSAEYPPLGDAPGTYVLQR